MHKTLWAGEQSRRYWRLASSFLDRPPEVCILKKVQKEVNIQLNSGSSWCRNCHVVAIFAQRDVWWTSSFQRQCILNAYWCLLFQTGLHGRRNSAWGWQEIHSVRELPKDLFKLSEMPCSMPKCLCHQGNSAAGSDDMCKKSLHCLEEPATTPWEASWQPAYFLQPFCLREEERQQPLGCWSTNVSMISGWNFFNNQRGYLVPAINMVKKFVTLRLHAKITASMH